CELQRAVGAGDRIDDVGVEEAHIVVHFAEGREEVIAESEVERELRGDLPVVLNVGRDGTVTRAILLHQVLGKAASIDLADEEAGVGETGVWDGGKGAIEARRFGHCVSESQKTGSTCKGCDVIEHPGDLAADRKRVLADVPLHVVEQRVIFGYGDVGLRTAPVGGSCRACEGNDREAGGCLPRGKTGDTQVRRGKGGCDVGIEGGTVVPRVAVLELVNDFGREDMRLFDNTYRSFWSEGLTVVVRDR